MAMDHEVREEFAKTHALQQKTFDKLDAASDRLNEHVLADERSFSKLSETCMLIKQSLDNHQQESERRVRSVADAVGAKMKTATDRFKEEDDEKLRRKAMAWRVIAPIIVAVILGVSAIVLRVMFMHAEVIEALKGLPK